MISPMVLCFDKLAIKNFGLGMETSWNIYFSSMNVYYRWKRREISMFEPLLVANIVSTKQAAAFETN